MSDIHNIDKKDSHPIETTGQKLKGREINLSKETQIALACLNRYLKRIADAIETIADNTKKR
tara:strand:+ start:98 stop:283 length:186 start_codon:yes stop_codon:yes gene_type:complete